MNYSQQVDYVSSTLEGYHDDFEEERIEVAREVVRTIAVNWRDGEPNEGGLYLVTVDGCAGRHVRIASATIAGSGTVLWEMFGPAPMGVIVSYAAMPEPSEAAE